MTALSIRHMHFAMREQEVLQAERDAAKYACLPAELQEESHYWFIERKSKSRKGQWIFVRDFFGSKRKAAELFVKHYRNQPIRYRLVHKLKY